MTRRDLASTHLYSERAIRLAISELNLAGYPVVSTGSGFVLAKDAKTIRSAAALLMSQAQAIAFRVGALDKLANDRENLSLGLVA